MKICVLPFDIDVEMRAYHNKSFPLGIIKSNLSDYRVWLCNKLVNCVYRNSDAFDSLEEDIWSFRDGLTFPQNIYIAPKTISYSGFDLIEFNKTMLDNECYITGAYNEFYIPEKKHYQNNDFNHDYIIFGYDDERKVFKSAAYIKDKTYSFFDLSYENYYLSVVNNKVDKISLNYYRINKDYVPQINIQALKAKLENYLLSRKDGNGSPSNEIYGMNAWNLMAEYVLCANEKLDLRFGRVYMEHRSIMMNRIQILKDLSYIADEGIVDEYRDNVYEKAQGIHHMFIKFNITKDKEYLFMMSKTILEINHIERKIIEKLVNQL